eukprot:scaffold205331_cov26-Prasinocladus_malaysianus.AAC.1
MFGHDASSASEYRNGQIDDMTTMSSSIRCNTHHHGEGRPAAIDDAHLALTSEASSVALLVPSCFPKNDDLRHHNSSCRSEHCFTSIL